MAPPAAPEPAPEQSRLADEPIAAAAAFDASPASLAASEPEPVPAIADDFTRMKGVGPKLAERLNALGLTSFAEIAALTTEQADALDAQLGTFQGRIHRDRWIEQAGFLARGDTAGYEAVFGKL
jgi:predicted flap endonuclease-1-like 5' DNA nuclease